MAVYLDKVFLQLFGVAVWCQAFLVVLQGEYELLHLGRSLPPVYRVVGLKHFFQAVPFPLEVFLRFQHTEAVRGNEGLVVPGFS